MAKMNITALDNINGLLSEMTERLHGVRPFGFDHEDQIEFVEDMEAMANTLLGQLNKVKIHADFMLKNGLTN